MGETVCHAVADDPRLSLVAAVDRARVGDLIAGVTISDDRSVVVGCDVVVDFSIAAAARDNLPWLAEQGIHAVVGATGFTDDDLAAFRTAFDASSANCLIAPNFAISAVVMMKCAELAAPYFDTVEVIEYHHNNKIDAPSGTAVTTAERIAAQRGQKPWSSDPTEIERFPGARGGQVADGVRVHAVRMAGMVAHQEAIFGSTGQTLTIRQDSYDRASFMPGVVLACAQIANHPGLVIGLDAYLGLG